MFFGYVEVVRSQLTCSIKALHVFTTLFKCHSHPSGQ